jgi:hypothetical protein
MACRQPTDNSYKKNFLHDVLILILPKDREYPPHQALFKIPKKIELSENKSIQQ